MGHTSDMHSQTRLHKRGATYYIRLKVPADLRRHYGKREIKLSLGTKDPREAAILVRKHSVALDAEFEALRHASDGIAPPGQRKRLFLDDTTIQALCDQWRHLSLDGDEWSRRHGLSESEYEECHVRRQATQDALRAMLSRGQTEKIYPALKTFLDLLGFDVPTDGDSYRSLAYRFLQTATETMVDQLRRDSGDVVRTPEPAALPITSRAVRHGQPTLDELLHDWEVADTNRPGGTVDAFRLAVREFHELRGIKPATEYVRKDFLAFRDHLRDKIKRKPKTIQKKINFLGAIFQVAVDNEKIPAHPCSKIMVKNGKKPHTSRLPYPAENMNRIYQCSLYRDGARPLGGGGEAAVWLPVLAPLTGARIEELAQLRTWDIKREGDIWYFDIVEDDDPEFPTTLKTESSQRRLPVHPKLIELGFLNYVESRQKAGRGRLFPKIRPDSKLRISGNWSKWWGRYARKAIGIRSAQQVFHSFRHGFRDRCREAELDEEISDALSGRGSTIVGRGYGNGFSVARLHDAISRINYPHVVFPEMVKSDAK